MPQSSRKPKSCKPTTQTIESDSSSDDEDMSRFHKVNGLIDDDEDMYLNSVEAEEDFGEQQDNVPWQKIHSSYMEDDEDGEAQEDCDRISSEEDDDDYSLQQFKLLQQQAQQQRGRMGQPRGLP